MTFSHARVRRGYAAPLLGIIVIAHGIYILASTLLVQIAAHKATHISELVVDVPIFVGLSLIYLGALLRRHKRTAWLVTVMAYTFYLVVNVISLLSRRHLEHVPAHVWVRELLLPPLLIGLLTIYHKQFVVKSDIQGFGFAVRFSAAVLLIAFAYGVAGFSLLDTSDFHQEINFGRAAHYTVDQFNITTKEPLRPYTRRAKIFVDSLSLVSIGAVAYVGISLFQPLRARFSDPRAGREHMRRILDEYGGLSEDFFKLWPHDKQYFFDDSGQSGLALHVSRGVALCLSDPVGNAKRFPTLLQQFADTCFNNDWLPAFIHAQENHRQLYEACGFTLQRLGQEAVVDLRQFKQEVAGTKYFRQIRNKFERHGYSYEMLQPPHNEAVLQRLNDISKEWLQHDARTERGFVMGYFTPGYMQQCSVLVARDAADTIQAFVNLVPADFDKEEATYDMLRATDGSLGNVNDFLLMNLADYLLENGYKRLNLGLCPLAGIDEPEDQQNALINNFLRFAYANGDKFFSFKGLYRFKAKYEPEWRTRYVVYQGGVRGFTRTMTALMRIMKVK